METPDIIRVAGGPTSAKSLPASNQNTNTQDAFRIDILPMQAGSVMKPPLICCAGQ
jgi:hypothetical protein